MCLCHNAAARWRANDFPSLFAQVPSQGGHSGMNPFAPGPRPRPRFNRRKSSMKSIWFVASLVAGAVALAPGCSANPLYVGQIDGGGTVACASAGGPCVPDASAGGDAATADARPDNTDGGNDDAGSGTACTSAGGTCFQASVSCGRNAPTRAQDCNGGPNSAGAHCCLTLSDAGSGRDGGDADAAPSLDDGGSSDSAADGGGRACASAGGTCINPDAACAIGSYAPAAAQDCQRQPPLGFFCCLNTQ